MAKGADTIVFIEYTPGQSLGGHDYEYLLSLQRILDNRVVLAMPFLGVHSIADPRSRIDPVIALGGVSIRGLKRYWIYLKWGLLMPLRIASQARDGVVIACQAPWWHQMALAGLVARFLPAGRLRYLFFVRRDPEPLSQARWMGKATRWGLQSLSRRGQLMLVSDSMQVLRTWEKWGGSQGYKVPVPVNLFPERPRARGVPVFGLLGSFRQEKGAADYDRIVSRILDAYPEANFLVQIRSQAPDRDGELARAFLARWKSDPRLQIVDGALSGMEYLARMAETDIFILPYDTNSYGAGTSGILVDAIANGRLAISARLSWAQEEFSEHPGVIWMDDFSAPSIVEAAGRAISLWRSRPASVSFTQRDDFAASWRDLVRQVFSEGSFRKRLQ